MREESKIPIFQAWTLFHNIKPNEGKKRLTIIRGQLPRQLNDCCRQSVGTNGLESYILRCKIYLRLNFLDGQLLRENDLLPLPDKENFSSCSATLISRELEIEPVICRTAFVPLEDHIMAQCSDGP